MTSRWMTAYNAADVPGLMSLYDKDAELVAGELAHLEGEHTVQEREGTRDQGGYVHLWMRDGKDLAHPSRDVVEIGRTANS